MMSQMCLAPGGGSEGGGANPISALVPTSRAFRHDPDVPASSGHSLHFVKRRVDEAGAGSDWGGRRDQARTIILAYLTRGIEAIGLDTALPLRDQYDVERFMRSNPTSNWYWGGEGVGCPPFTSWDCFSRYASPTVSAQKKDGVEVTARWAIEYAWKALNREASLEWEPTAVAVVEALYRAVGYPEKPRPIRCLLDSEVIDEACRSLHGYMMKNRLWGADTDSADRTIDRGHAKGYADLSKDLQANYEYIILSAAAGIVDHARYSESW